MGGFPFLNPFLLGYLLAWTFSWMICTSIALKGTIQTASHYFIIMAANSHCDWLKYKKKLYWMNWNGFLNPAGRYTEVAKQLIAPFSECSRVLALFADWIKKFGNLTGYFTDENFTVVDWTIREPKLELTIEHLRLFCWFFPNICDSQCLISFTALTDWAVRRMGKAKKCPSQVRSHVPRSPDATRTRVEYWSWVNMRAVEATIRAKT